MCGPYETSCRMLSNLALGENQRAEECLATTTGLASRGTFARVLLRVQWKENNGDARRTVNIQYKELDTRRRGNFGLEIEWHD